MCVGSLVPNCAWQLRPPARCARPELHSGPPCFSELAWLFKALSGKPNSGTRPGERTLKYCCFCGFILVFDLFSVVWTPLHVGIFCRSAWGRQGEEQYHVAIRVDGEPTCCDVGAVPGRSVAMCGDPQGYISNGWCFRQCNSGKNRLICSEDQEQVACVSVHCKLGTRATQLVAYRCWRAAVKFILCSGSAGMCSSRCGKFSPAGEWRQYRKTEYRPEIRQNASEKLVP